MAYQQHDPKSCCFSSLDFNIKSSNKFSAENKIVTCISPLLTGTILDNIVFENAIMTDESRNFKKPHLRHKLEQWKKYDTFDILNNISKYVTLVHFIYIVGNVNHALSVVGRWIFESN